MDQFSLELRDLFEDTLLLGHDKIVISTSKSRTLSACLEIELNSFDSFLFIAFLGSLSVRFSLRIAWSLALQDRGWRIRSWRFTALFILFFILESFDGSSLVSGRLCWFFILLFEAETWAMFAGTRLRTLYLRNFIRRPRSTIRLPLGSRCINIQKSALVCFFSNLFAI